MYVTSHAKARLHSRIHKDLRAFGSVVGSLESMQGEEGTVVYLLDRLDTPVHAEDGSNGEIVVAVAVDGSVDTIYLRRKSQDLSAAHFGARKVVSL